ncbi:hypothetical protein AAE478_007172 [Parahypoxylon ruwenzoriense]
MHADSVEARLARIEAKLDRLGDVGATTASDQLYDSASTQAGASGASSPGPCSDILSRDVSSRHSECEIPPLTEILPVVEDYFRDFNSALPLFHQHCFMKMLYDFYSKREPTKKRRAVWAAINVILAIGYRIRMIDTDDIAFTFGDERVKKCIDNTQAVLEELVVREEDTLGIQVLLGLVTGFNGSKVDPKQDVSLRTTTPSIQLDEDLDLDLPGIDLGDDGSYLQSIDGRTQLNYLRARIQLAYLEGKVYDYLFSNRSTKLSPEARQEKVVRLSRLLAQWRQTIPQSLQLEKIAENLRKAPLTQMILLYHTYLLCLTHINGLYSLESPWIKSINGYSSSVIINFDNRANICMTNHQPLLPHVWAACVSASRGCLKILTNEYFSGCNLWLSGCAYFSAFVVLLANIVYFPLHELADHDRKLTMDTMWRMGKLLEHTKSESYMQLHVVLIDLGKAADFAIEKAKRLAVTFDLMPPTTQADYPVYNPVQFQVLPTSDSGQNTVSQPEILPPDSTWLRASTLDGPGIDLTSFEFDEENSAAAFVEGFSY